MKAPVNKKQLTVKYPILSKLFGMKCNLYINGIWKSNEYPDCTGSRFQRLCCSVRTSTHLKRAISLYISARTNWDLVYLNSTEYFPVPQQNISTAIDQGLGCQIATKMKSKSTEQSRVFCRERHHMTVLYIRSSVTKPALKQAILKSM